MPFRRKLLIWLGAVLVPAAPIIGLLLRDNPVEVSMLDAGEAAAAIAALRQKASQPLRAGSVTLDGHGLKAELQGASPEVSDTWHVAHLRGLFGLLDWEYVPAPQPVQNGSQLRAVRTRMFDVADVDFAAVPSIVEAAIRRAALEEAAAVTELTIERPFPALGASQSGNPRWAVTVRGAHESARVFADAGGRITGANLDGTLRAQRLNLQQGGAPLLDVIQGIQRTLGAEQPIKRMLVHEKTVRLTAPGKSDPARTEEYSAGLNGVFRDAGLGDIPRIAYAADAAATWTLADVDWAALPSLLARARQVLDAPDAAAGLIEISRKARGLGQPTIEWEISLELPQRESGRVTLDNAGGIRRVQWPHGREPAANLLDPALARRFVEALAHDAGPHAGVMQIMLRPDGASATIRDPRKPAALLELGYAGVLLETSSIPNAPAGFWQGERYDDEWMFDLRELDATVLDGLPALQRAALGRLKIGGGAVAWISIGRHRTTFEGNRRLLAEVGVAGPDRQSGRVFLDARTGALLRLYGP